MFDEVDIAILLEEEVYVSVLQLRIPSYLDQVISGRVSLVLIQCLIIRFDHQVQTIEGKSNEEILATILFLGVSLNGQGFLGGQIINDH